jgi:hypothetical protein
MKGPLRLATAAVALPALFALWYGVDAAAVFTAVYVPGMLLLDACRWLVESGHRVPLPARPREPVGAAGLLLRLAVRRTPAAAQAELYSEWSAELHEILRGPDARPYRRAYHALRYTLGLVWAAPRIAGIALSASASGPAAVTAKTVATPRHTGWDNFWAWAYSSLTVSATAAAWKSRLQPSVFLIALTAVFYGGWAWCVRVRRRR